MFILKWAFRTEYLLILKSYDLTLLADDRVLPARR